MTKPVSWCAKVLGGKFKNCDREFGCRQTFRLFHEFGLLRPNSISHRLDRGQCSRMQALAVAERGSEAGRLPALELNADGWNPDPG
ncbi:MAG: hypothetical protein ABI180_01200 [Microcoleus sp.]